MARTVYWALSNNEVAEAAGVSLNSLKEGLQFTGRKGVIAALFVATSLLAGRSLRPLSSVPATGLALVGTILELASSLEFSIDDEEEDDGLALTLHILPSLQVHPLVSCQTPPVILSVLVLLYASCHAYVQPETSLG